MADRTIVIGDVHGCIQELQELLKLVGPAADERVIFTGDLIDRGPDPAACIGLAREIKANSVLGNHEEKYLRWLDHEEKRTTTGKKNPMRSPAPERKAKWDALSADDIQWIREMQLWTAIDAWIDEYHSWYVVHAGFEPGRSLSEQRKDKLVRVRYVDKDGLMVPFEKDSLDQPPDTVSWTQKWYGPNHVVYGHDPRSYDYPVVEALDGHDCPIFCVGLDTGCVFGGKLSALILDDHRYGFEIIQVKARRNYCERGDRSC